MVAGQEQRYCVELREVPDRPRGETVSPLLSHGSSEGFAERYQGTDAKMSILNYT